METFVTESGNIKILHPSSWIENELKDGVYEYEKRIIAILVPGRSFPSATINMDSKQGSLEEYILRDKSALETLQNYSDTSITGFSWSSYSGIVHTYILNSISPFDKNQFSTTNILLPSVSSIIRFPFVQKSMIGALWNQFFLKCSTAS
jgi:hypothetical protein